MYLDGGIQIKQVFNYPVVPKTGLDKAKDFWIFSYLCNGINMNDIARLRWNNINTETIIFEREKTKRTKRASPVKIIALRNDRINAIIEKWSKKNPGNPNAFVFNVIEEYDDAKRVRTKIQQFIHVTNEWMKKIGEDLKFDLKLTTYVARHSFATILVRSGAPLALASQTLGHSNILTTQKYFAGFDLTAQATGRVY
jgi:integrase/recombinase XerD